MQEKGITTTSVIIYVIIATIVIATFSVITTDFYETLKKENKQSMYSNKYTEFMSYFAKDIQEKSKIRNFWLKALFIIYCLLLITILFLNNEYRMGGFQNISTFSREHLETSNFIPFATIIGYVSGMVSNDINIGIVIINLVTNLLLFAPMGFFIPMLFQDKIKNTKQFLIIIIILTFLVEIIQFITYRGSTDIDDIILNTIGASIVYMLMKTRFIKKLLEKVIDIT